MLKTHVFLGIHTRGNDLYWRTVLYVIAQTFVFKRISLAFSVSTWTVATDDLFNHFLKTGAEFLQLIDADVCPPDTTTASLVARDVDIVTAPVWMYEPQNNNIHLNVARDIDHDVRLYKPADGGLEEIENASFSAMLIRRNVIQSFVDAGESFSKWSPIVGDHIKPHTHDLVFCQKARALGHKLYVDWDIKPATHHKHVAVCEETLEQYLINREEAVDMRGWNEEYARIFRYSDSRK